MNHTLNASLYAIVMPYDPTNSGAICRLAYYGWLRNTLFLAFSGFFSTTTKKLDTTCPYLAGTLPNDLIDLLS